MTTDAAVSLSSRTFLYVPLICMIAGFILPGCEKNNQNKTLSQPASAMYEKATTLEGVVSDNHGPVKSGEIRAADRNNQVVASSVIHDKGLYSVTIPANTGLPVVLTYSPTFKTLQRKNLLLLWCTPTSPDMTLIHGQLRLLKKLKLWVVIRMVI